MRTAALLWLGMMALAPRALGADYHVSPTGDDANPGTKESPFRTIQHTADIMLPGDVCHVRAGTYRETVQVKRSGELGKPIRFVAVPGETVLLSGTNPIKGEWKVHEGAILKTHVDFAFPQLFIDGQMMVEARWPNMRFPDELWETSTWARAGEGSQYGKMVDPQLAKTGTDWTGARAVLNVAHQFFTWTRTVDKHAAGSDTFEYAKDLEGITHYADKTKPWEDDWYYIAGKLEALDAPGEWFLDEATGTLYVWPHDDGNENGGQSHVFVRPSGALEERSVLPKRSARNAPLGTVPHFRVEAKARNYAFELSGQRHIEIAGFHFFATSFLLDDCHHCTVEDCRLLYPTYARRISDPKSTEPWADKTRVSGSHNVIRKSSFAYSPTSGLAVIGEHNLVEDCLFHDMSWYGSLRDAPLRIGPGGVFDAPAPQDVDGFLGTARHNTVYNFGNAGLCFGGQPILVEYNHVYDGGLCCEDVSLIYTQLPSCAGSVVRHNWVHGCRTRTGRGLGIRGDDQTRGLTVHHNVVWDCGRDGIIVKGDFNKACNNTVFDIGTPEKPGNSLNLHTRSEPKKPWRKQFPLLERQNEHSLIFNNVAQTIACLHDGTPFPEGENVGNNFQGNDPQLADPQRLDFRPKQDSPLVDAGREVPGITDGYTGKAPDIGAYEYGGENWRPGITWTP